MTDSDRYRVVGDNHYHDGERLRTGDVFTPTESELAAFGHKFDPVDSSTEQESPTDTEIEGEAEADTEPETDTGSDESSNEEGSDGQYETYPTDDLEAMEWSEIRSVAADSDHPEIDGATPREEIIEALGHDG